MRIRYVFCSSAVLFSCNAPTACNCHWLHRSEWFWPTDAIGQLCPQALCAWADGAPALQPHHQSALSLQRRVLEALDTNTAGQRHEIQTSRIHVKPKSHSCPLLRRCWKLRCVQRGGAFTAATATSSVLSTRSHGAQLTGRAEKSKVHQTLSVRHLFKR